MTWRSSRGLALLAAALLLPAAAQAATDTWVGDTSALWATGANWSTGSIPGAGDTAFFGKPGAAGLTLTGPAANVTLGGLNANGLVFGGAAQTYTLNAGAGGITLSSTGTGVGVLDLSPFAVINSVPTTFTSDQTVQIGATSGAVLSQFTFQGTGSLLGGQRLIKEGTGVLLLNASSTALSGVTINNGVVQFSGDIRLSNTPPATAVPAWFTLNGGEIRTTGNTQFTINKNRGITLGASGGAFSVNNTSGVAANYPGSNTIYDGVITGSGPFTKVGNGFLTLGGASTYTGATQVVQGQLTLDFREAGAPTTNILSNSSALTMGGIPAVYNDINPGGTLFVNGGPTATNTQTFNGTTIAVGSTNIAARGNGSAFGTTLDLGAITHNAGGVVAFTSLTDGAGGTSAGVIHTSTANTNGILGGWATTSAITGGSAIVAATDWASVDVSGNIVPYASYTVPTGAAPAIVDAFGQNLRINNTSTGNLSIASTVTNANTIQVTDTVGRTIALGGKTLRLGEYGALWTATAGGSLVISGTGALTAGAHAIDTAGEIVLNSSAAAITISSIISNNGTGVVDVVKTGAATTSLSGINTYTGGTYINQGILSSTVAALGTGDVTILNGGQLTLTGGTTLNNNLKIAGGTVDLFGVTLPSTSTVTLLSNSTLGVNNVNGATINAKITGDYTLGVSGGTYTFGNTANDYSGNLLITVPGTTPNSIVKLGANDVLPNGAGKGYVSLTGGTATVAGLDLNGKPETINGLLSGVNPTNIRVFNSLNGSASTLTLGDGDHSAAFAGTIVDGNVSSVGTGTVAITKIGTGAETFSGLNTYTGATTVNNGSLIAGVASTGANGAFGNGSNIITANTAGATLALNGFNTTVGTLSGGGAAGGNITLGTATITTGNAGSATFAGSIGGPGGLTKVGTGTQTLTGVNSYTGATSVNAGALLVGVGGVGNLAGTTVTVASGATLGGSGTIGGATTIQSGGTLSPGNSPGVLTQQAGLTLATGSNFNFELIADSVSGRGTLFDGVNVTGGTLTVGSGVNFNLSLNSAGSTVNYNSTFWDTSESWLVFSDANAASLTGGIFSLGTISNDSLGNPFAVTGGNFSFGQIGNDVYLNYAAVPEPSTYAMLGAAGVAFVLVSGRRRRSKLG